MLINGISREIRPGANLYGANLYGANLHSANLRFANLHGANLRFANLHFANLHGANLHGADLHGADLRSAGLRGANLSGADLHGAKDIPDYARDALSILPAGNITGWKKCQGGILVILRIPESALRSNAAGRKCRAEYADVIEVIGAEAGHSLWNSDTVYRPGERVRPDSFDTDWTVECGHGIHFFITRSEAENF